MYNVHLPCREFGNDRLNQLQNMGSSTLHDLEDAVQGAFSYLTESKWPIKRWPVYVFTGGCRESGCSGVASEGARAL